MADISDLTNLADSTPEDAAKTLENAVAFKMPPANYVELKPELDAIAEKAKRPSQAEPGVARFLAQSKEHTSLAMPDVEQMNWFERQARLISDHIFDRPTVDRKIVEMNLRKMEDPSKFSDDDETELALLNEDRAALAQRNYGIDGPILAPMIGGAVDMARSMARGAAEGIAMPGRPRGPLGVGLGIAFGIQKDSYDTMVGATYNELGFVTGEDGLPVKLDHDTKKNIARGVGVVSTVASSAVGMALAKTTPFLQKFLNPNLAQQIVTNPSMAAVRQTIFNIGKAAGTGAAGGGAVEVARIFGEELARTYDGSEASFLGALEGTAQRWEENAARVGQAALISGGSAGIIAAGTGVAGFRQTQQQFKGISQFVDDYRAAGARDVTPEAPARLRAPVQDVPAGARDVTPEAPAGPSASRPALEATKVIQLREAMGNMVRVMDSTKMNELSPAQTSQFKQMIFSSAGLKKIWISAEDQIKYFNDPKRGEAARNIIDPSGVAAGEMNSPVALEPHKFMELVREFPEALEAMRVTPDGPSPLLAEEYLGKLEASEQKRQDLLMKLGAGEATPEDVAAKQQALNTELLDSTMPQDTNVEWLPTAANAREQYMTEPTFTKAIENVLSDAEVARLNQAQLGVRGHVANAIDEAARLEMLELVDLTTEEGMEAQRSIEEQRLQGTSEYAMVDKFRRDVVVNEKGKAISMYAIDPQLLNDKQAELYGGRKLMKEHGVFVKGGVSPDVAGEMMGLGPNQGDEVLRIMGSFTTRKQAAAAKAEKQRAAIEEEARVSTPINEAAVVAAFRNSTKNHIIEMKIMREKQWPATKAGITRIALPLPRIQELTNRARSAVASTPIQDLNVNQYKVGERKSQRIAVKAILKNEVNTAFKAKEAAALNSEFQLATMQAIGKVNRVLRFARKFDSPKYRNELEAAGKAYTNAANEILDVFNLNPSRKGTSELGAYQAFVKSEYLKGNGDLTIPERLSDIRQSVNELTVEQLSLIGDRLANVLHLARMKNKLYTKWEKQKELQTAEAIQSEIEQLAKANPNYDESKLPNVQNDEWTDPAASKIGGLTKKTIEEVRGVITNTEALLVNMEHAVTELDQEYLSGRFHDLIVKPIKGDGEFNGKMGESGLRKDTLELQQQFKKIIEEYGGQDKYDALASTFIEVPDFIANNKLDNGRLSKANLIVIAANMGDPDGRANLANLGVSTERMLDVLNVYLDEKDVALAQNIVNAIGSYGPRSIALQKETTGETVELIQGVPWQHRGKEIPGGYFPQAYTIDFGDPVTETLSGAKDLAQRGAAIYGGHDATYFAKQAAAEMTPQGRLQARVGSNRTLDLSVHRLTRSFEEILHDLNFRKPVADVLKILDNPANRKHMAAVIGTRKFQVIRNTVVEVAGRIDAENNNYFSDQNRFMKQVYGRVQTGFTVAVLGANITSVGIQFVSILPTVQKMGVSGPKHLLNVVQKIARNPRSLRGFYDFAAEINPSIKSQIEEISDSTTNNVYKILPSKSANKSLPLVDRVQQWTINKVMAPLSLADITLKTIESLGAYEQFMAGDVANFPIQKVMAMSETERHQAAIDYARQLSRTTLTHGADSDRAPIQKLPISEFFVKFWNDLRNVFNNYTSAYRHTKNQVKYSYEQLSNGDYPGAKSSMLGATGTLASMFLIATIARVYEDLLRGKDTPLNQDFDFTTLKGQTDAATYMTKYMTSAPADQFLQSIPVIRDIKFAAEKPEKRTDMRNVQMPIVKILTDFATTGNAISELLTTDREDMSEQQLKSTLFASSYIFGGFPVNGPMKFQKWMEENYGGPSVQSKDPGLIEKLRDQIKDYLSDPPKGTEEAFLKELREYEASLTPTNFNLPENAPDVMKYALSEGDWKRVDPKTGAAGVYQFTEERWNEIAREAPELGLTDNGRVAKDTFEQDLAIDWESKRNAESLRDAGVPVTTETALGAHILGFDDYLKVHKASADSKTKTVLGAKRSEELGLSDVKTIGGVKKWIKGKLDQGEKRVKELTLSAGNTED